MWRQAAGAAVAAAAGEVPGRRAAGAAAGVGALEALQALAMP